MVPDSLALALDYFRAPLRYAQLADPERPLPQHLENLVDDFGVALAPRNIADTARDLGVRPEEIERAARYFLRQVLLSPGSSHYRALGVSPGASDEAIRRNYRLLIRIFHPDRSAGDDEQDAACTARIIEAYRVLKDSAARLRYDRYLVSSTARGETESSPPRSSPARVARPFPFRGGGGSRLRFPAGRQTFFLVWGGIAVALAAALAVLLSNRQPFLRANTDLADSSAAKPSYLRESPLHPSASPRSQGSPLLPDGLVGDLGGSRLPPMDGSGTAVPAAGDSLAHPEGSALPEKAVLDQRPRSRTLEKGLAYSSTPAAGGGAGMTAPEANPEGLIARLTSYYQAGDLNGFLDLFSDDAQLNDGRGKDFIRAGYAGLFAQAPERRLSISALRWQPLSGGKMIGRGVYRVRVKDGASDIWRSSTGTLLIELVPGVSGFKISKLIRR